MNRGGAMSQDESRPLPAVVDRSTFREQLEALRAREKAHTREGDAIAAARRRLPMVEVAADSPLLGPQGPVRLLDVFEGRRPRSSSAGSMVCSTWCATCATATGFSRRTGRSAVEPRCWTTAT